MNVDWLYVPGADVFGVALVWCWLCNDALSKRRPLPRHFLSFMSSAPGRFAWLLAQRKPLVQLAISSYYSSLLDYNSSLTIFPSQPPPSSPTTNQPVSIPPPPFAGTYNYYYYNYNHSCVRVSFYFLPFCFYKEKCYLPSRRHFSTPSSSKYHFQIVFMVPCFVLAIVLKTSDSF